MVSRQLSQWVDVIMFVYSYSSPASLDRLLDINRKFREFRCDSSEPQVLLVGVVGNNNHYFLYIICEVIKILHPVMIYLLSF